MLRITLCASAARCIFRSIFINNIFSSEADSRKFFDETFSGICLIVRFLLDTMNLARETGFVGGGDDGVSDLVVSRVEMQQNATWRYSEKKQKRVATAASAE